jgi:hypothetical protein
MRRIVVFYLSKAYATALPSLSNCVYSVLLQDSCDRFGYFTRAETEHPDPTGQEFSSHGHSSRAALSRAIPLINLEFGAIFGARSTDSLLPPKGSTSC